MGFFTPKVPNTISDRKWAALQGRARVADKESMFSKRSVKRRKAASAQLRKSRWS